MKTAIAMAAALTLAALTGCRTSPEGGTLGQNQGFKISVPMFNPEVKQGELQLVNLSLQRDSSFMQDVKLKIQPAKGIRIEPDSVVIKASDRPEVQLKISAPKDAALGEYPVVVKGTPETGYPTSVGFTVNVVAP